MMSKNITSPSLNYRSWMVLLAIAILVFIMNIDYTAVNLALVPIAEEIDGELNILQWLLSGYILVWAAFVVPAGRLADLYGKKSSLIGGIIIFTIASIITGMGHNIYLLIAGRLLQGLGAAIFSSPAYGLVFTSVPTHKQGMAMGVIGGASGLGLAAGPTIAGWIINEIGWRWIFYINIPLCALVTLIILQYAKPDERQENAAKIDWLSVFLLSCGLGSFVFALNQIEVWGITDSRLIGFGVVGMSSLALFYIHDKKQPLQTIPRAFLYNKPFMGTVAACFLSAYCFALILVMMSLYLQNTLHLSTNDTGLYFLSMTLVIGVLSPFGGKLADHMDIRIPMVIGSGLTFSSLLMLSLLDANSSPFFVCSGFILGGLGLGIGFPSLNTALFRTLNPTDINTGSGIFTMSMMLGNSISVIVSTSFLVLFGQVKLMELIAQTGMNFNTQERQTLIDVLGQVEHTPAQLKTFPSDQIPALLDLIDQAFLHGFRITFWIGMGFSLLAAIIILMTIKNLKTQHSANNNEPIMGF